MYNKPSASALPHNIFPHYYNDATSKYSQMIASASVTTLILPAPWHYIIITLLLNTFLTFALNSINREQTLAYNLPYQAYPYFIFRMKSQQQLLNNFNQLCRSLYLSLLQIPTHLIYETGRKSASVTSDRETQQCALNRPGDFQCIYKNC